MAKQKYKYRALFKPDSLDVFSEFDDTLQGDGRALGYAQAWHKGAIEKYTIANEYVAAEIGRFMRLPIPPFAITQITDDSLVFSSLDFNFLRAKLPEIIPEYLWRKKPDLSTGILVFDILIANEDRNSTNLVVDRVKSPKEVIVFDHDQSLFSGLGIDGIPRLDLCRDKLGIIKNLTETTSVPHCLMELIDNDKFLYDWIKRVNSIPDWFLKDICNFAKSKCELTNEETDDLVSFLVCRRNNIEQIIKQNKDKFSSVEKWKFDGDLLK